MRINKLAVALALGVSALGLSACATGFPAKVSRYSVMPAPQGQSFFVVPGQGAAQGGGLEFQRYANMVTNAMVARGYQPAPSVQAATMIVQLGYDVDDGETKIVEDPLARSRYGDPFYGGFYDPFYRGYYGRPYYSRYGYYGGRYGSPFYYGWDDPYWYSPYGYRGALRSYTEYRGELDIDIRRRADNASLFEGTAKARSRTDDLGVLVPNLITAMFTGFPNNTGKTVKITVPADQTVRASSRD